MRKFGLGVLVALLLLFTLVPAALAADLRTGSRLVVESGQTVEDDIIFSGVSVVIDGAVHGDVFAFANTVTVNGTIDGNLFAFGANVDVEGTVTGTVVAGANDVLVHGRVGGTLVTGGSTLTLDSAGSVGRNWIVGGDQVISAGHIGYGMLAGGNRLTIAGQVDREVRAYVNDLSIAGGAAVGGPVDYTSNRQANIAAGARTGQVSFHQSQARTNPVTLPSHSSAWFVVLKYVGFVLCGLVLFALFPGLKTTFPQVIREKPWQAPLAGFLSLLAVPVGAVILLATIVGIPLSLVVMLLFPVMIYLGQILLSFTVGRLVADRVGEMRGWNWALLFVGGALVTTVLVQLPIVGGILAFAGVLYGLGGLYYTLFDRRQAA
ncbi:MAG TPA: polymer-forming cytoskeletal protein [Symbiobacteriaceae bacterium]